MGCHWIFKIKFHADGTIEHHKARPVAQRFYQKHGINFEKIFSPIVRRATVQIILSSTAMHNWHLHQLDIKNVILHGHLSKEEKRTTSRLC